jgi:CRISPR-associated protein Csb2
LVAEGDEFLGDAPLLVPLRKASPDGVVRRYTEPSNTWHTFTPVILPGHDDHKPQKTRSLIERALLQSGIEQPCEFEWSAFSRFPKSYSAHKYDKDKRPQGYYRPSYLLSQTAVHLTLRFKDNVQVPGPIVIGAGRHCGFGLFVGEHDR